jgi:hypothetical protein
VVRGGEASHDIFALFICLILVVKDLVVREMVVGDNKSILIIGLFTVIVLLF